MPSKQDIVSQIVSIFLKLVAKDPLSVVDFAFDILQRIPLFNKLPGMYEVIDYEVTLHIRDKKGATAVYTKQQHIRFLQDNIIAFQDKAWGDGEIFADYKCSPGVEVDRYRDGHRYNILISLRETKHRDDELTFHVERTIKNGFTATEEAFQTDIDHRTRKMTLNVVFPVTRLPTSVKVVEQNTGRSQALTGKHRQILPDGTHKYTWKMVNPRLYESYIIDWVW
ncbi:MAG: hypothetical protein AAFV98_08000 [Chloroflexota bacterium]